MEISQIKSRLSIYEVLQHYGLTPNAHGMLCCPFHDDKTPSMQVNTNSNTVYCHSGNCAHSKRAIDVIDFIMHKESISKHQAIEKAAQLCTLSVSEIPQGGKAILKAASLAGIEQAPLKALPSIANSQPALPEPTGVGTAILQQLEKTFTAAIWQSPPAKAYCQKRSLTIEALKGFIGFNSGQFHHSSRKSEELINACVQAGMLQPLQRVNNQTGETVSYKVFAKYCLTFILRDKDGKAVSLYGRSIYDKNESKHFYLTNRKGLYPSYPKEGTSKLILTESIIDAATLLQLSNITASYGILALYGTNGLTEEHITAIVSHFTSPSFGGVGEAEIIFALDSDDAGNQATIKHYKALKELLPQLTYTTLSLPNKDLNEVAQAHEDLSIFEKLISERQPLHNDFFLSTEQKKEELQQSKLFIDDAVNPATIATTASQPMQTPIEKLNTTLPHKLYYEANNHIYYINGGIKKPQATESLKVSVQIVSKTNGREIRTIIELYDYKETGSFAAKAAQQLYSNTEEIEQDLSKLTQLLEQYRETLLMQTQSSKAPQETTITIDNPTQNKCINFLKDAKLLDKLNQLLEKAGISGEEKNRLLLFLIAMSYKMPYRLHALVQGSSGSGKSHLLNVITSCIPHEDMISITRATDGSFYNFGEYDLVKKLIVNEDLDGYTENALYAFRELISRGFISNSSAEKNKDGEIYTKVKTVLGKFASMSATTKGEIYEDNMSRSLVIAVDESTTQTQRIIDYQNKAAADQLDTNKQKQVQGFLQNCIRLLQPLEVVNPFASKLQLPEESFKRRRLNEMFQHFVKLVTLLHQYQRNKDDKGRLITQKEDVQMATDFFFDCIVLKCDELDGGLRQFFEALKTWLEAGNNQTFTQREIRQALKVSRPQVQRYINSLLELEYIQVNGGFINKGLHYRVQHWDSYEKQRSHLRQTLTQQIERL